MRRLFIAASATLIVALFTIGCGGSGSNPIAPLLSPSFSSSGSAPGATVSVSAVVPDFARCLRDSGPECFTAGSDAGSTAPVIHDIGQCLQPSPAPGCTDGTRAKSLALRVHASAASPAGLTYTANGGSVTLTWTAPPPGDVILSYIIEAGSASGFANLANISTGSTATSFSASGVGAGTYFVRVRGMTASGPTDPSNEAVVVVAGGPCSAPTGSPVLNVVSNQGGTVVLAWSPVGGTASYILEAGTNTGLSNLVNVDLGNTTTLTATDVALGTYYVRVRGRNACASNEVVVVVGAADIEYRVTGTPGQVFITYVNASGETAQTLAPIPWSFSLSGLRPGAFLFVSAQQQVGGTVAVSIYRNGVLYKTSTAEGANAIALASGTF